MPWYWILIILSAIVGPFEAMHALNKARRNREEAEKRKAMNGLQDQSTVTQTDQKENEEAFR